MGKVTYFPITDLSFHLEAPFCQAPDNGHLDFLLHTFSIDYFRILILELLFQNFLLSFLWSLTFLTVLILLLHFNYCYIIILYCLVDFSIVPYPEFFGL